MRTPSDLPPRQRRGRGLSDRGRIALISVAVLVVVLLLSARFLSGFYIDYLWHQSVDRSDVFLVQAWEEARTEVVAVPSTPAGITLTTSDGYVLLPQGGRFFGGTQARLPQEHPAQLAVHTKVAAVAV